jgi:TolB-like protein/Tfp pilus assembly protein PilF
MSSIIEGYKYDVFISYRQKDNKGDRWISEFVESLKTELESTFKEEINVYFDINPHDGLLEIHDVDDSLKDKLRCLIFIPIVSRTYCDPKSFAWEHEFKAFIEQASQDKFGLKVKLADGNVANRVLPIQIHDLDIADSKEFESELGSALRGIEFIYREPGVNKPLMAEDNDQNNLNKTKYRIQINKTANAIKEILLGMTIFSANPEVVDNRAFHTGEISTEHEKSIAVLPFVDISPEKDQDYFCDGVTEEIINSLAHIESFKVIARTSTFAFKSKQIDIREIGRILDVETLLEGSIRKAGDKLRITAQLIRVSDGSHIWSERYDREMKDVFSIQDEISQAIVDNLKIKLLGETKSMIARKHTANIEAYNLFLKGTYCYQMSTSEGFVKAMEYFRESLDKDPDYALAYIGLANTIVLNTFWGNISPGTGYTKALEYADEAMKIDKNLAEVYWIIGLGYAFKDWKWNEAEQSFKSALQLNPNSSMIHNDYARFLSVNGRHEEAISEAKRAQEIDPLSAYINTTAGAVYSFAGKYDIAMENFRLSLTLNSNFYLTHLELGNCYMARKMIKKAIAEYEKASSLTEGNPIATALLVCFYYRIWRKNKANRLFESLKKRAEKSYVPASSFFIIYVLRKEEELALEWLRRACNERDTFLIWIKDSQVFPEGSKYRAIIREYGLVE